MIQIRKSNQRGHADHGWLKTYHTFSFGQYHDPEFINFRTLRVLNEDWIRGGSGFPQHGHQDMEIITYIVEGALEHKDSMGNGSVIRPGDVQKMSAGTGVEHSEFNHLTDRTTHLLQIWITPEERGIKPAYQETSFAREDRKNRFCLIGSPDGRDGSVTIRQDAGIYATLLDRDREITLQDGQGRNRWVQLIKGDVTVNGHDLAAGDGAAIVDEASLTVVGAEPAEFLTFDLG